MNEEKQSFPLCWPEGWKRTPADKRRRAKFSKQGQSYNQYISQYQTTRGSVSMAEATKRTMEELARMGISDWNVIISTNVQLRNDGMPRSGQKEPQDPGVAVFWRDGKKRERAICVDHYDRVADNLAAVAATLAAMRSIERHGGAEILDRAFTGFTALPSPTASINWRHVFGFDDGEVHQSQVKNRYMEMRRKQHPDHGGSHEEFIKVQEAYRLACEELGVEA